MAGRAAFLNPPIEVGRDFVDYPYFADYGLLAAAAWAARAGWTVEVADAFAMEGAGRWDRDDGRSLLGVEVADFLAMLPDGRPDVVVVNHTPFLDAVRGGPHATAVLRGLRDRWPDATLVLADCHPGGMNHVAYDGRAVLDAHPGVDAVVRYAGESWMADPARLAVLRGRRVSVDDPAGDWPAAGPPMPLFEALDPRRWGAFLWHAFEDGRWANPFGIDAATRPVMTSSGCPYRCVFCTSNPGWRATGRKPYRVVPLPALESWLYLLARGLGARRLAILDDVANLRPDFEEVLALLERLDLSYVFPNGLRADRLSDRAIERMKGRCPRLSISAESGTQADLSGPIGKRLDLAEVDRVAATAARAGVPLMIHWVVGFPWETPAHVQATLALAWHLFERHGAEPAVQFATPVPGSALYDACAEAGLLPAGGIDAGDPAAFQHAPAFRPPALPAGFLETATGTLARKVEASRQRKVIVNVTYECINHCAFCAVSNRVRRDLPWERLRAILDDHRAKGVENLDLDGGEPTLHPHLLDAVRHARAAGYRQVNVTTNGRRLADAGFARDLLASGLTGLLVSLHGATADVHDALTGVEGSFDETLAGLRNAVRLRPEGLDLGVNVTLARGNVDRLEPLADLLVREGVTKANFQFLTPFGSAGGDVVPPVEAAAAAMRGVIDRYGSRLRILVVNAQFCLLPGYEAYLAADLGKLGRTMVFVWEEEVNLFDYLAARRVRKPQCDGCAYGLVCEGFFDFGTGERT